MFDVEIAVDNETQLIELSKLIESNVNLLKGQGVLSCEEVHSDIQDDADEEIANT